MCSPARTPRRRGGRAIAGWLWPSVGCGTARLPGQRRSQTSENVLQHRFLPFTVIFIYMFAFSHADGQHQWLRAVVCIPEPSKSSCLGAAFKRAGSPRSTWAVAVSAKWVVCSTSFQQYVAGCLYHERVFEVWLWSEKSQRATVKMTS